MPFIFIFLIVLGCALFAGAVAAVVTFCAWLFALLLRALVWTRAVREDWRTR